MKDQEPFAIAGLCESWAHEGSELKTMVVLTTTPNPLVEPINGRMPVILMPGDWDAWLDPANADIQGLLRPFPAPRMDAYRVGRWVNNPRYDSDRCIEPLPA
jgi:putative SOS response-associated peptidase YedK